MMGSDEENQEGIKAENTRSLQKLDKKVNMCVLISSTIIFGIFILIERLTILSIDETNEQLAVSWQNQDSLFQDYLFIVLSYFIDIYPVAVLMIICFYLSNSQIKAITLLMMVSLIIYYNNILKLLYSEQRPFIAHSGISSQVCTDFSFGNPSGHAQVGLLIFIMLPWSFYSDGSDTSMLIVSSQLESLCRFVQILVILGIGMARVYLGVHSYGQVLLGWIYSTHFLIIFKSGLFDFLNDLLQELHQFRNETSNRKTLIIILSIIFYLIAIVISIVSYEITQKQLYLHEYWYENINNTQCKPKVYQLFYHANFIQTGIIGLFFGILIGALLNGQGNYRSNVFWANFKQAPTAIQLKRFFVLIFTVGFPLAIAVGVPLAEDTFYGRFFMNHISMFLAGGLLCFTSSIIYNQLGIGLEGDFMYIEPIQKKLPTAVQEIDQNKNPLKVNEKLEPEIAKIQAFEISDRPQKNNDNRNIDI